LHFPKKRSLGRLSMQDESIKITTNVFDWRDNDSWEYLAEARGDVVVPVGKRLSLFVNQSGIKDLSPLSKLGANDLYEVIFPWPRGDDIKPDDGCMPHIAHLTGLKILDLRYTSITSKGLRFLRSLKSLEQLYLPVKTTNAGLAQITGLQSLKKLCCVKASFTSTGLVHLVKLRSLVELDLDLERNCDGGMVYLAKLPLLRSLIIHDFLGDAGVECLSGLSGLQYLDITDTQITDEGLGYLSGLSGLKHLNLTLTQITDTGLVYLRGLRSLRNLDLSKTRITDIGMPHLAQIKSLESLELPTQVITDRGLAHVGKLGKLKFLSVGESSKSSISDTGLRHLSKLDLLEELNIAGTGITNTGMLHIGKLAKLKQLRIGATLTDEGLAKLTTLKSLNQLTINSAGDSTKITISGLTRLNEMSNLTYLNVDGLVQDNSRLNISGLTKLEKLSIRGDIRLSDQDLACFANLTHLKWLQGIYGISDVGAAYLKNLTSMERLTIGGADLTDRGLSYLSNMNNLNNLTLRGNFTDEGLRHLEKLKSLKLLKIYSANNFSPTALEHLRSRLPNLRIFNVKRDRKIRQSKRESKVGDIAPPFVVKTLDGKELKLEDYHDKAVLLYFWAMWCKPCVASTPRIKSFYKSMEQYNDFEMIGLSLDDSENTLAQYINQNNLVWPQVCLGLHSRLAADYGLDDHAPVYILVGPDGRILLSGTHSLSKIEATVQKVLADKSVRKR